MAAPHSSLRAGYAGSGKGPRRTSLAARPAAASESAPLLEAYIIASGTELPAKEFIPVWWQTAPTGLSCERVSSALKESGGFVLIAAPSKVVDAKGAAKDGLTFYAQVRWRRFLRPIQWKQLTCVPFIVLEQGAGAATVISVPPSVYATINRVVRQYLPSVSPIVAAICADANFIEADIRQLGDEFAYVSPALGEREAVTAAGVSTSSPTASAFAVLPDLRSRLAAPLPTTFQIRGPHPVCVVPVLPPLTAAPATAAVSPLHIVAAAVEARELPVTSGAPVGNSPPPRRMVAQASVRATAGQGMSGKEAPTSSASRQLGAYPIGAGPFFEVGIDDVAADIVSALTTKPYIIVHDGAEDVCILCRDSSFPADCGASRHARMTAVQVQPAMGSRAPSMSASASLPFLGSSEVLTARGGPSEVESIAPLEGSTAYFGARPGTEAHANASPAVDVDMLAPSMSSPGLPMSPPQYDRAASAAANTHTLTPVRAARASRYEPSADVSPRAEEHTSPTALPEQLPTVRRSIVAPLQLQAASASLVGSSTAGTPRSTPMPSASARSVSPPNPRIRAPGGRAVSPPGGSPVLAYIDLGWRTASAAQAHRRFSQPASPQAEGGVTPASSARLPSNMVMQDAAVCPNGYVLVLPKKYVAQPCAYGSDSSSASGVVVKNGSSARSTIPWLPTSAPIAAEWRAAARDICLWPASTSPSDQSVEAPLPVGRTASGGWLCCAAPRRQLIHVAAISFRHDALAVTSSGDAPPRWWQARYTVVADVPARLYGVLRAANVLPEAIREVVVRQGLPSRTAAAVLLLALRQDRAQVLQSVGQLTAMSLPVPSWLRDLLALTQSQLQVERALLEDRIVTGLPVNDPFLFQSSTSPNRRVSLARAAKSDAGTSFRRSAGPVAEDAAAHSVGGASSVADDVSNTGRAQSHVTARHPAATSEADGGPTVRSVMVPAEAIEGIKAAIIAELAVPLSGTPVDPQHMSCSFSVAGALGCSVCSSVALPHLMRLVTRRLGRRGSTVMPAAGTESEVFLPARSKRHDTAVPSFLIIIEALVAQCVSLLARVIGGGCMSTVRAGTTAANIASVSMSAMPPDQKQDAFRSPVLEALPDAVVSQIIARVFVALGLVDTGEQGYPSLGKLRRTLRHGDPGASGRSPAGTIHDQEFVDEATLSSLYASVDALVFLASASTAVLPVVRVSEVATLTTAGEVAWSVLCDATAAACSTVVTCTDAPASAPASAEVDHDTAVRAIAHAGILYAVAGPLVAQSAASERGQGVWTARGSDNTARYMSTGRGSPVNLSRLRRYLFECAPSSTPVVEVLAALMASAGMEPPNVLPVTADQDSRRLSSPAMAWQSPRSSLEAAVSTRHLPSARRMSDADPRARAPARSIEHAAAPAPTATLAGVDIAVETTMAWQPMVAPEPTTMDGAAVVSARSPVASEASSKLRWLLSPQQRTDHFPVSPVITLGAPARDMRAITDAGGPMPASSSWRGHIVLPPIQSIGISHKPEPSRHSAASNSAKVAPALGDTLPRSPELPKIRDVAAPFAPMLHSLRAVEEAEVARMPSSRQSETMPTSLASGIILGLVLSAVAPFCQVATPSGARDSDAGSQECGDVTEIPAHARRMPDSMIFVLMQYLLGCQRVEALACLLRAFGTAQWLGPLGAPAQHVSGQPSPALEAIVAALLEASIAGDCARVVSAHVAQVIMQASEQRGTQRMAAIVAGALGVLLPAPSFHTSARHVGDQLLQYHTVFAGICALDSAAMALDEEIAGRGGLHTASGFALGLANKLASAGDLDRAMITVAAVADIPRLWRQTPAAASDEVLSSQAHGGSMLASHSYERVAAVCKMVLESLTAVTVPALEGVAEAAAGFISPITISSERVISIRCCARALLAWHRMFAGNTSVQRVEGKLDVSEPVREVFEAYLCIGHRPDIATSQLMNLASAHVLGSIAAAISSAFSSAGSATLLSPMAAAPDATVLPSARPRRASSAPLGSVLSPGDIGLASGPKSVMSPAERQTGKYVFPVSNSAVGLPAFVQCTVARMGGELASFVGYGVADTGDYAHVALKGGTWEISSQLLAVESAVRACGLGADGHRSKDLAASKEEDTHAQRTQDADRMTGALRRSGLTQLLTRMLSLEARARDTWLQEQEDACDNDGAVAPGFGGLMSSAPLLSTALDALPSVAEDVQLASPSMPISLKVPPPRMHTADDTATSASAKVPVDPATGEPLQRQELMIRFTGALTPPGGITDTARQQFIRDAFHSTSDVNSDADDSARNGHGENIAKRPVFFPAELSAASTHSSGASEFEIHTPPAAAAILRREGAPALGGGMAAALARAAAARDAGTHAIIPAPAQTVPAPARSAALHTAENAPASEPARGNVRVIDLSVAPQSMHSNASDASDFEIHTPPAAAAVLRRHEAATAGGGMAAALARAAVARGDGPQTAAAVESTPVQTVTGVSATAAPAEAGAASKVRVIDLSIAPQSLHSYGSDASDFEIYTPPAAASVLRRDAAPGGGMAAALARAAAARGAGEAVLARPSTVEQQVSPVVGERVTASCAPVVATDGVVQADASKVRVIDLSIAPQSLHSYSSDASDFEIHTPPAAAAVLRRGAAPGADGGMAAALARAAAAREASAPSAGGDPGVLESVATAAAAPAPAAEPATCVAQTATAAAGNVRVIGISIAPGSMHSSGSDASDFEIHTPPAAAAVLRRDGAPAIGGGMAAALARAAAARQASASAVTPTASTPAPTAAAAMHETARHEKHVFLQQMRLPTAGHAKTERRGPALLSVSAAASRDGSAGPNAIANGLPVDAPTIPGSIPSPAAGSAPMLPVQQRHDAVTPKLDAVVLPPIRGPHVAPSTANDGLVASIAASSASRRVPKSAKPAPGRKAGGFFSGFSSDEEDGGLNNGNTGSEGSRGSHSESHGEHATGVRGVRMSQIAGTDDAACDDDLSLLSNSMQVSRARPSILVGSPAEPHQPRPSLLAAISPITPLTGTPAGSPPSGASPATPASGSATSSVMQRLGRVLTVNVASSTAGPALSATTPKGSQRLQLGLASPGGKVPSLVLPKSTRKGKATFSVLKDDKASGAASLFASASNIAADATPGHTHRPRSRAGSMSSAAVLLMSERGIGTGTTDAEPARGFSSRSSIAAAILPPPVSVDPTGTGPMPYRPPSTRGARGPSLLLRESSYRRSSVTMDLVTAVAGPTHGTHPSTDRVPAALGSAARDPAVSGSDATLVIPVRSSMIHTSALLSAAAWDRASPAMPSLVEAPNGSSPAVSSDDVLSLPAVTPARSTVESIKVTGPVLGGLTIEAQSSPIPAPPLLDVEAPPMGWTEIDTLKVACRRLSVNSTGRPAPPSIRVEHEQPGLGVPVASARDATVKTLFADAIVPSSGGTDPIETYTYLQVRAASMLYRDHQLHAITIVTLMTCLMRPDGAGFRTEFVQRMPAVTSLAGVGPTELSQAALESSRDWDGNSVAGDDLHSSWSRLSLWRLPSAYAGNSMDGGKDSHGGLTARQPSGNELGAALRNLGRSFRGPLPEAMRDVPAATAPVLKRVLTGVSVVRPAAEVVSMLAKEQQRMHRLSSKRASELAAAAVLAAANAREDQHNANPPGDQWTHLDAHPVYVLQCHLNHPGNLPLVNIHVRDQCERRGRPHIRLLRMLSAEFFQPAHYDLRHHIASGAYGSVIAAVAAGDSPAAMVLGAYRRAIFLARRNAVARLSVAAQTAAATRRAVSAFDLDSTIEAAIGGTLSPVPRGSLKDGTAALLSPGADAASQSNASARDPASSRDHAGSVTALSGPERKFPALLLPAVRDISAEDTVAGEVHAAVKVISFPEDATERCILADVLPEVAILEEITQRYIAGTGAASETLSSGKSSGRHSLPLISALMGGSVASAVSASYGCPSVCLLDYGVTGSAVWIVMERCTRSVRSWRLERWSQSARLDRAGLLHLLALYACIVYRLGQLHDAGVSHYDVKCDNVLLREGFEAAFDECRGELAARIAEQTESHPTHPAPPVSARSTAFPPPPGSAAVGSAEASLVPQAPEAFWHTQWRRMLLHVCFTDFGESVYTPGTPASRVPFATGRGTECARAPEQLRAARAGGHNEDRVEKQLHNASSAKAASDTSAAACDVWSAGCLLFELLTGSFLFQDDDWARFYLTVTGDASLAGTSSTGSTPGVSLPLLRDLRRSELRRAASGDAAPILEELMTSVLVRDPASRPSPRRVLEFVQQAALRVMRLGEH